MVTADQLTVGQNFHLALTLMLLTEGGRTMVTKFGGLSTANIARVS